MTTSKIPKGASFGAMPAQTAVPKIRFEQGNHSDFYRTVKTRVHRYLARSAKRGSPIIGWRQRPLDAWPLRRALTV